MSRRLLIVATIAAGLTVVAIQLVMQRLASEPQALPASIHRVGAKANEPLPTLWPVPAYRLVDQNGQTRTPEDLRGSVWVADFIFTSCKSVCPVLSAKMVQLQRAIPDPRMKFVSFSVDPDRDTPEALRAYARRWAPDESRWTLLANTQQSLEALSKGMKTFVERQPDPDATLHSAEMFLIDGSGRVRGLYATDGDSFEQLVPDARKLLRELQAPTTASAPATVNGEDGAALYRGSGCAGCHDVPAIAPSLAGIAGRPVMLAEGQTTTATAEYLRESILDPAAKIVATYPPSMPGYRGQLSDAQVDALVRYIQGLQAPEGAVASTAMAGQGAAVDPVCGMSIHAGPETVHVTHQGRTVYFCSDHCRDRFVANPGAFSR
jgi:protein SCO1/2